MFQGSKRVSSHLNRFHAALRKLADPDAALPLAFGEFLENQDELRAAIERGELELSSGKDGSIFFHTTPAGFIARERSVSAEFKERWLGRKPGPEDFNHALADDHPHNVAWAKRMFQEQETAIAELKANPSASAPRTITTRSDSRVTKAHPAP